MTLERARCGLSSRTLAALRGLPRIFTHPQNAVDFAALLDEQPFGRDVAVDHAGRLQLDALLGIDATAHFPADDRQSRDRITAGPALLGEQRHLRCPPSRA